MKKITFVILLAIPFISLAHSISADSDLDPGPIKGFPTAGDGTKIIPLSQMSLPESVKKKELLKIQQMKTKGYIESTSNYPSQLLHMGTTEKPKVDEVGVDPFDTKLKKHLSQIRLAFPFGGIPFVENNNVIGFGAIGAWENGWTGVVEIFNYKNVGTCKFRFDYGSSNGRGVNEHIMAEAIRYDVNNKPTTLSVEGNKKTAFLYEITWSDKKHFYDLECANAKLDPKIAEDFIELAKNIDKSVNSN